MLIENTRSMRLLSPILLALGFTLFLLGSARGLAVAAAPQGSAPPNGIAANPPPPAPLPPQAWLNLLRAESPRAAAAFGGGGITLNINLTDAFAGGRVPLPATVYITHTRGSQIIGAAHATPIPDIGGYFFYNALSVIPQPDDVLWARQAGQVISLTVPAFNVLPNAVADLLTGNAPPDSLLHLTYLPFDDPQNWQTHALTVPQSGAYSLTLPLRPRDEGYALWGYGTPQQVYARFYAAFLQAQVDGSSIEVYSLPHTPVSVCTVGQWGALACMETNTNARGTAILGWEDFSLRGLTPLQAGQTLTATVASETITLTLPALTALPIEDGSLRGETMPGAAVQAVRCAGGLPSSVYAYVPLAECLALGSARGFADASGAYTLPLGWQSPEYGAVFVTLENGQQAFARFAAPFLQLWLYDEPNTLNFLLRGQFSPPYTPFTVTVSNAAGLLKTLGFGRTDSVGRLFDMIYGYEDTLPTLRFDAGDMVTITNAAGQTMRVDVPTLTAQINPYTGELLGVAPPGVRLTVTVPCQPYRQGGWSCPPFAGTSQVVTASLDGAYQVQFPPHHLPYYVDVEWRAAPQYTVTRRVLATVPCPPRPYQVFVGGDWINFGAAAAECDGTVTLTLRDPNVPKPKYFREFKGGVGNVLLNDRGYSPYPILILPGDVLQVSQFDATWQWTVPRLTVTFDITAQALFGYAPPLAVLNVVHDPNGYDNRSFTATAAADGSFYLPLPEDWQAQPGDIFQVSTVVDGVTAAAVAVWQQVRLSLYTDNLDVILPPLTPFTVTQFSEDGTPLTLYTGLTSNYGNRWASSEVWLPGMRLQIESTPFTRNWVVPQTTVWVDMETGTVRGSAPPFAVLRLTGYFAYEFEWHTVDVTFTADANGMFEFRPAAQPFLFAHGTLTYIIPNTELLVEVSFRSPGFARISMANGVVNARATQPGEVVTVTLQTASGVFTESVTSLSYSGDARIYFQRRLYPGNVLTLIQHGRTLATVVIPNLQARLFTPQGQVYGNAPAGARVEVWFGSPNHWYSSVMRYAVADSAGSFTLDVRDMEMWWGSGGTLVLRYPLGMEVWQGFELTGYETFLPLLLR